MLELYIITILFIFFIGLITIFSLGVKKHYFYLFVTGIQIFYIFNTPFYRFLVEDFYAINVDVKDYFPFGFSMILLHVFLFNIFYFITFPKLKKIKTINIYNNEIIKKVIYRLFIFLYILIFINTLLGGVNLIDVILGRANTTTLGMPGATYYIQNFADSLITLLVAAYIFKVKKTNRIIMFILGFVLFIILGFRYRILLTIFAIVLYNIYKNGIKASLILRYLVFGLIFFYSILFLTYNRVKLYSGFYEEITYDPSQFNYNIFFDQAKGSLVDFALYKALDNDVIESDKGETMFIYVFIKMIPAKFFTNGTKPYPPPFLPALDKAIDGSRDFGEASTILGSFYFTFSYFGIILISILLGISVKRLTVYENTPVIFLFNLMIMMAIFQFYTRGYLPMFVDHLAYLLFPLVFIKKYAKDIIDNDKILA